MQWKVVIIGSGNVATVLAKKIKNAGHIILQVVARQVQPLQKLAAALGTDYAVGFDNVKQGGDLYIVAVTDEALANINIWLPLKVPFIVHTAGSVPADVLKDIGEQYGTLYPFQSLKSDRAAIPDIPLLLNASSSEAGQQLSAFAHTLSDKVQMVDDATKTRLHIAAVVTNNFTNHLFTLANDFCNKEKLDFSFLRPLLEETVNRLEQYQPDTMQTGPAIRGDDVIIQKHLSLLHSYPELAVVYEEMTKSIQNWYHPQQRQNLTQN